MKKLLLILALTARLFAENISGTYVGNARMEMPNGLHEESFTIVLKEDGERFQVTGAPTAAGQQPAKRVGRAGNSLRFEITPPGQGWEPVKFDVTVKKGIMTGKMRTISAGREISGSLLLTRK